MEKTGDLFKKIRDSKERRDAMMDIQEQKIFRGGGKNTQKNCTQKIFTTWIIRMV